MGRCRLSAEPEKKLYRCVVRREFEKEFYVRATDRDAAQEDAENLLEIFTEIDMEETDTEAWVDPSKVGRVHAALPTWSGGPDGNWE